MNKDVGISWAPSRFHAVIFECFTEGISPGDAVLERLASKIRNIKVPFDSTLLSPTFVPHPLAYNPPEHIVVHVFPLFYSHICHDFGESYFLVLCPWPDGPVFGVLDVIPIAVPAIRCHPTNSNTDFLPLLSIFQYGTRE
jgi:hypothetical protein